MTIILNQDEVREILVEHLVTEIASAGKDNIRSIDVSNMTNSGRTYDVVIEIDLNAEAK